MRNFKILSRYYEFRSEFAVKNVDEVDFDRRLNLTEENFKSQVFTIYTVIFQLSNRFHALK